MQQATSKNTERKLYAVAIEAYLNGAWQADIRYLHADSWEHARVQFTAAHGKPIMERRLKIVGIAPVVGYFVENDTQGRPDDRILSV